MQRALQVAAGADEPLDSFAGSTQAKPFWKTEHPTKSMGTYVKKQKPSSIDIIVAVPVGDVLVQDLLQGRVGVVVVALSRTATNDQSSRHSSILSCEHVQECHVHWYS